MARRSSRPARCGSALLGLGAAADDLVAAPRGDVDPGVGLAVALRGPRARRVGRLTVVLARLGDAVALLVLELRHRRRPGLGRGLEGQRQRDRHRGRQQHARVSLHRRLHGSIVHCARSPSTPTIRRQWATIVTVVSTLEPAPLTAPAPDVPWRRPRFWQRLGVRLAALFALVTLLAVGLVGTFVYQRQRREVEDMVGTQLLNIARTAALLVDPATHAELQRASRVDPPAYARIQRALAAVQSEVVLTTPIYTLADYEPARRRARVVVTSGDDQRAGQLYTIAPVLVEPLGWTLEDGVARYTRVYENGK